MANKELILCMNCLYFDGVEDEKGFVLLGLCKRNAPSVRGFPRQRPTDGCGEGRLDENKMLDEETQNDYERLEDEQYQEPNPYIRTDNILAESDSPDVLNRILGEDEETQKKT